MNTSDTLPAARYYSLAWEIPSDFAGMTTALLRRGSAFERVAGRAVDVLTFDARPHYPELERSLRERGMLSPAARLINLWDWLREHPATGRDIALAPELFDPLAPLPQYATTERNGAVLTRARMSASGDILQLDHYRTDGSLLASDRRDVTRPGTLGGRSIVLCDPAGRPVRHWRSAGDLYRRWLDLLCGGSRAVMIVDSKTTARFMLDYRRRNVTIVHVLHGSHLDDRREELRASRRDVVTRLGEFDLIVTLTATQKRDLEARFPRLRNVVCIPHSVADSAGVADPASPGLPPTRDPAAVAVVAALIPRKRVSHAIRAAAALRESPRRPRLVVYGDGPQRPKLEQLIARLDARDIVALAGHVPGAAERLETARALLLTSHSEGFGLVLLEAMAHGCIPIAYDVPYGPADIIENGVNGFLVEEGDLGALAARLAEVLAMEPDEIERMRAAGRATVAQHSDEAVTAQWGAALRGVLDRPGWFARLARSTA